MAVYTYVYYKALQEATEYVHPTLPYMITKEFVVRDINGIDNVCVKLKGSDTVFRGRSEMLIIKDDMIYLDFKSRKNEYRVPGGGWDTEDRSHQDSAIRETNEEALMEVKDVRYSSTYVHQEDPHGWVKKKVPKDQWWYGYYTEVYTGYYAGKFKGKVGEIDKDSMSENGEWYKISDVYDKLKPAHREAIQSIDAGNR